MRSVVLVVARTGWIAAVLCGVLAIALSACGGFERDRLAPMPTAGTGPMGDGGNDMRDGAVAPDRDGSTGVDAGDGGGAGSDAGDSGAPDQNCEPSPAPSEACPQICDEICNDLDDDCDGEVDEAGAIPLCRVPHATGACVSGECLLVECDDRYRDCDRSLSNGCEASLDDVATCGSCTNSCDIERALEGCEDGECVPIGCEPGYDECDSETDTVCETEVNTAAQCGACDAACTLDHAVPECEDLECVVQLCDSGYDDCDDVPDNGCEAPLDTLEDCGACDTPCALASCGGGVCSASLCTAPDADCNGDGGDCEVDLATDVNHCGACNSPCTFAAGATLHATGLECEDLQCEPICDPNYGDCDPNYRNGCETLITTVQNCGACGNNCNTALANTATTSCAGGTTCEITTCAAGFDDCDGMDATGCETSLRSTANCGGCSNVGANETCTGLPNASTSSCGAGSCVIDTCMGGFANCDGLAANGCERNTTLDGPCTPDTNCTKRSSGSSDYYFCTNDSTWTAARDKCRLQRRGDLVHIDDMLENAFVQMHRTANAWIGASDLGIEGLWRWSSDGVPFWRGLAAGSTQLSQYARWSTNQPDDAGGAEDCAEMWSDGTWNDQVCTSARDFVCEEISDQCPSDASKLDPGQCGCGTPDTDADNDGFATCNDGCPADPNKLAAGVCGCGTADTNTDGDSQPDCNELCDTDPNKLAPGICGCGVSDVDTDGDGTPDCQDGCPVNASSTNAAMGCGLGYVPPNVNVTLLNPNQADATTTFNCAAVLNTSGTPSFTTWCSGAMPQITIHSQTNGPELVVVALRGLSIPSGGSLRIQGSRPAVIVVFGNASIVGTLDAGASGTSAHAGGNYSCGTSAGTNVNNGGNETGGGGGGGFGTAGGRGGNGDDTSGGNGGVTRGATTLVPLLGGCNGGSAGGCTGRGAGGGAIQLSVAGALTISGVVRANGGAGPGSCGSQYGGGGGGSGGGIRLEAASLTTSGSTIQANGANGGSSGTGGGGGSTSSGSTGGTAGNSSSAGGGGGGGGYGRIVLCNRTTNAGC
jgi:hypothetical protein